MTIARAAAEKIANLITSESDGSWVIPPAGITSITQIISDAMAQDDAGLAAHLKQCQADVDMAFAHCSGTRINGYATVVKQRDEAVGLLSMVRDTISLIDYRDAVDEYLASVPHGPSYKELFGDWANKCLDYAEAEKNFTESMTVAEAQAKEKIGRNILEQVRSSERQRAAGIVSNHIYGYPGTITDQLHKAVLAAILDGAEAEDRWCTPPIPLTPLGPEQSRTITGYTPEKTFTQAELDAAVGEAEGICVKQCIAEVDAAIRGTRENDVAWVRAWFEQPKLMPMTRDEMYNHILAGDEVPK